MTSYDDDLTRDRVEKSGAAAHLWKPFDEDAVLHAIRGAVGGDRNHREPWRDATKNHPHC